LSGLGKGIALASIGKILSSSYKVFPIKCDGYLNTDPGTMNPIEHGEVFVLDDGSEVDMDFGHYERFLNTNCTGKSNLTMGKVFEKIREKERRGDYLGKTVQMIPHVADFIKNYFISTGKNSESDVILIEIGGTVGDMENELYLEAVKMLAREVGKENTLFVHTTYVPIPYGVKEQKSKPTQQSVSLLKQKGIEPQIIIARCSEMLSQKVREKIALNSNLEEEEVITGIDVDTIYKIPLILEKQGMSRLLEKKLGLQVKPELEEWKRLIEKKENAKSEINIAIAGKYTNLEDSYASVIESLHHCEANLGTRIKIKWIETTNGNNLQEVLKEVDGVIVPGGFGARGVEGKISVIKYCRENKIPFLGLCYGLQMAVIEFARNLCGLEKANTSEVDSECEYPVVDILPEQKEIETKGGTMRLGSYTAVLVDDSKIKRMYNEKNSSERHRHRYEVNPKFHDILKEKGLIISGTSSNARLAEFIELQSKDHPYFVATQAHPELKSRLENPSPLFLGLVKAAINHSEKRKTYNRREYI